MLLALRLWVSLIVTVCGSLPSASLAHLPIAGSTRQPPAHNGSATDVGHGVSGGGERCAQVSLPPSPCAPWEGWGAPLTAIVQSTRRRSRWSRDTSSISAVCLLSLPSLCTFSQRVGTQSILMLRHRKSGGAEGRRHCGS